MSQRPPIGIEPRYIWIETRLEQIENAVTRIFHEKYAFQIPMTWIEEYNDLIKMLGDIDKRGE